MTTPRIRTALFTPGTDAVRLRKAIEAGADICIFDLEDSVARAHLQEARATVASALVELAQDAPIWVRIHPATDEAVQADLVALPLDRCAGLVLPKTSGRADVERVRVAVAAAGGPYGLPILPIIESAAGVLNAAEIAADPDVALMALGRFDLAAELGIDPELETPPLLGARASIVLASSSAGLPPPLDSPWVRVHDVAGLRERALRARRDGFGGMLLIHPSHVQPVREAFQPTSEEVTWARSVLSKGAAAGEAGRGAFLEDGAMVDEAILRRARGIIEQAEPISKTEVIT
jgi:citrate lyase beta subunit